MVRGDMVCGEMGLLVSRLFFGLGPCEGKLGGGAV